MPSALTTGLLTALALPCLLARASEINTPSGPGKNGFVVLGANKFPDNFALKEPSNFYWTNLTGSIYNIQAQSKAGQIVHLFTATCINTNKTDNTCIEYEATNVGQASFGGPNWKGIGGIPVSTGGPWQIDLAYAATLSASFKLTTVYSPTFTVLSVLPSTTASTTASGSTPSTSPSGSTTPSATASPSPTNSASAEGLSSGAKAGIGVGVAAAALAGLGAAALWFVRRRRNQHRRSISTANPDGPDGGAHEIEAGAGMGAGGEKLEGGPVHEAPADSYVNELHGETRSNSVVGSNRGYVNFSPVEMPANDDIIPPPSAIDSSRFSTAKTYDGSSPSSIAESRSTFRESNVLGPPQNLAAYASPTVSSIHE